MINIFETSFEARERRFQIERLYHGETVDLVGVVTTDGVPQNITGYSVSGVFQPTSMNGSPDFYELSADIVDNKVIVHWEKGKDFGENSYMVWALLTDGDNASYPIVWRLDMAYSPSYPLSALDPIPRTIDFDKYDLLNAPWLPLSDVQSVEEDVLLSVSERYLPLSGGTIDGGLVVTSEISAENFTASIAKGVSIGDSSVSDNGVVIGFNSGTSHGSVAIGNGIESDGFGNTNIGLTSKSKGDFGIAIGQATEVSSIGIAIGYDSKAVVPGAVAIGTSAKATAKNAIQIGSTVVDESSWTEQVNSVPHSLKVMDKMVLSGDNLTLDPERVPYLSGYAKKEEIPEVPTDLSAFTNSPGYLTAHQSLEDYYTKTQTDEKLTAYAQLSDLENIDVGEMSACLSSAEFDDIEELPNDGSASLSSIIGKIDELIRALKRANGPQPVDPTKTRVVYNDSTTADFDIVGTITKNSISNISDSVDISLGNTVTAIGSECFRQCTLLRSITIPNSVSGFEGNFTFSHCENLTDIEIPNSITVLNRYTFDGCHSLSNVVLPSNMTDIGEATFNGCWSLTSIVLPTNLASLKWAAFYDMSAITSIDIPDSVTSIERECFYACKSLAAINFGTTRSTVPSLANTNAFGQLPNNYTIYVPASILDTWKATSNWSSIASHIVANS